MRKRDFLILILAASAVAVSCNQHGSSKAFNWGTATLEEKMEHMRSDTVWMHQLDSIAEAGLGAGAKCIDPIKHTFLLDGRTWIYNQDWGGALEIPEDYLVEDDTWQVDFSFHGTRVFSPDSLVLISFYGGFQAMDGYEDFKEFFRTRFDDEPYVVITGMEEMEVPFGDGFMAKAVETRTITEDEIVGLFRDIYKSPDGVEYSVSIQYPMGMEYGLGDIIDMICRYPFGPDGLFPGGDCI